MNILTNLIGALAAITYVGFFAYKVNEPPLSVIVVICLCLMVYAFYDDTLRDRAVADARRENERKE